MATSQLPTPLTSWGGDDNDDPVQLLAKAAVVAQIAEAKKPAAVTAGKGAQPAAAKLPTKPAPPAQAGNLVGEVRNLLLYKSKFLLEMAKEHEKDMQIGVEEEEEEEYVFLELDDCLYSDIQPNAPYILSGLDTLTPTLIVGDDLNMIGEYEETVGTCYLFSESDAPPKPVRDETAPPKENKDKQASSSKEAPSKEVKHLASVQKILKFRSINEDHQQHRAYQHKGKEF